MRIAKTLSGPIATRNKFELGKDAILIRYSSKRRESKYFRTRDDSQFDSLCFSGRWSVFEKFDSLSFALFQPDVIFLS